MRFILYCIVLIYVLTGCSQQDTLGVSQSEKETGSINETNEKQEEVSNNDENTKSTEENLNTNEAKEKVEEVNEKDEIIEPQYRVADDWSIKPIGDANEKVVLLTIDDVPDTHTLEMAKTLKELNASAIFFVNGHFLSSEEKRELLKEIYDMGFVIGNHTFNHQKLNDVSEDKQREEIMKLSDLIEEIIGERPKFFRAPHGVNTDFAKQLVEEEGMTLMNWTYGYDYFKPYMDAEKLKTAMITGEGPEVDVPYSLLKPGANLLMHDRSWTAEALGDIVKGLREKGYDIVDPKLIETPE